jgi:altronate dehydratase small subunit
MIKSRALIMDSSDNCATAIEMIEEGEKVMIDDETIKTLDLIPFGHKLALKKIQKGQKIMKYGEIIAIATKDIDKGEWVHKHNVKSYYLEGVGNND